jgi:aerobic-type carbon monoxide dehydrogenase small subunit (CoxS/CutS family)
MKLNVNGKDVEVDADEDSPLLWALRDNLGLTATKYACGIAQCGNCSVLVNNLALRACITPLIDVVGKEVVTTEGLDNAVIGELRKAWTKLNVVQCGYCQPAQLIAATALLYQVRRPTDDDIEQAMSGVGCRCGTYSRIKEAIHMAAKALQDM